MPTTQKTRYATGHVGLNVSDLSRAKTFYQNIFGFEVMLESDERGRKFAFLKQDDALVLTLWEQSEGVFQTDRPGMHHLSFQVDSIDEVRDAEQRLRAIGATIHHDGIVPHAEGWESGGIYFEDPDGIRLEIFAATGAAGEHAAPHGSAPTCGFF